MKFFESKKVLFSTLTIAVLVSAYCFLSGGESAAKADATGATDFISKVDERDAGEISSADPASESAEGEKSIEENSSVAREEENPGAEDISGASTSDASPDANASGGSSGAEIGENSDAQGAKRSETPSNGNSGKAGSKERSVTLRIDCFTLLDRMDDLAKGKEGLAGNGIIMEERKVRFDEGETVFDVLRRETSKDGIHMEFSVSPVYGSAYIEGIQNLYEFDCGPLSGWMYNVNGWYPNYGCSQYTLKEGDVIQWRYTCDLGTDLGASSALNGRS
jgi:hypothetical protein